MKEIQGYLDITPGDFKEIYGFAFRHAHQRLTRTLRAKDIMTQRMRVDYSNGCLRISYELTLFTTDDLGREFLYDGVIMGGHQDISFYR